MSWTSRVVWREGMFLRPQHFQQQDRYAEALMRAGLRAGHLQGWGFSALEIDPAALDSGVSGHGPRRQKGGAMTYGRQ